MPLTDEDKAFLDLAWKMYNEQATQARQHETLRSNIATVLFGLAATIVGLHQFRAGEVFSNVVIAAFLLLIGIFGILVSSKLYERNRFHVARLRAYRLAIDDKLKQLGIDPLSPIGGAGDREHRRGYRRLERVRLNVLWNMAFGFICLVGLWLLIEPYKQQIIDWVSSFQKT
ncbi:hypothetical protein [Microvirga tunisiensis]|uniref:Uncharacterized protein n=1 Tax=Microvirga tunisiensis TaxID=2108360 RepID=A0A5N7MS77_9HYPH|nr:hypothetical protein [Microvirga tunisiensis]MPR11722.1 hypothetical protein [Microvirga tunisiensis]MPR29718.1 hypothetical protein [Microvirga tunisiensis]